MAWKPRIRKISNAFSERRLRHWHESITWDKSRLDRELQDRPDPRAPSRPLGRSRSPCCRTETTRCRHPRQWTHPLELNCVVWREIFHQPWLRYWRLLFYKQCPTPKFYLDCRSGWRSCCFYLWACQWRNQCSENWIHEEEVIKSDRERLILYIDLIINTYKLK